MSFLKRVYPFNAEQTVNILSEFGPLVTMFIVNGIYGKTDPELFHGTVALIVTTIIAMVVMRSVLGRFPVFPIIASSVTIGFGLLTLVTKDPMWVQIKVSIFNALFAGFLFGGLYSISLVLSRLSLMTVLGLLGVGAVLQIPHLFAAAASNWEILKDAHNPLFANLICLGSLLIGFLIGMPFRRNFFGYVFEKTFHYTPEGWDRFTYSFACFFVFTAILNEVVRQVFAPEVYYIIPFIGEMNGINIWILFKIAFIMPVSGLYAWYLTRLMQRFRIDLPAPAPVVGASALARGGQAFTLAEAPRSSPPTS